MVLDVNQLARGQAFFDLDVFELSDDGRYLAYSADTVGAEDYTLYIKDLETGALLADRVARVTSAAWSADGRELLYTVRDDTLRSYALRRHRLWALCALLLVLERMERIREDERHTGIDVACQGETQGRIFDRFSMGYAEPESGDLVGTIRTLNGPAALDRLVEMVPMLDLDS